MPAAFFGAASNPADNGSLNEPGPHAVTPPGSMVAGQLVVFLWQERTNSPGAGAGVAIVNDGGQTWSSLGDVNGVNSQCFGGYYCTFNGTWSANPSFDFPTESGTITTTAIMLVYDPPGAGYTWSLEAIAGFRDNDVPFSAPSSPFTVTITPQATTGPETITLAGWACSDDNTWSAASGSGWADAGSAQYRNTAGSDQSISFAHAIRSTAGTPANVSKNMNASDPGVTGTIIFKATPSAATLNAEAGSYAIAGAAATMLRDLVLVASAGAYAINGQDATLARGHSLNAEAAAYAITGADATPQRTYALNAEAGSYVVTGADATPLRTYLLDASSGTYLVLGADAEFSITKEINAEVGSYALTGADATLARSIPESADAGSYAIAGQDATLLLDRILQAEAGTYAITGADAELIKLSALTLNAEAGSYIVTGAAAELLRTYILNAEAVAYAITGQAAELLHGYVLDANGGVYVITGADATLVKSGVQELNAEAGSYVISGASATLVRIYILTADGGVYQVTGAAATLVHGYMLNAGLGAYVITGGDAFGYRPNDVDETIVEDWIESDDASPMRVRVVGPIGLETPPEPTLQELLKELRLGPKQTLRDDEINQNDIEKYHNDLLKVVRRIVDQLPEEPE